jgi:GGDEF domain-containing protein
MEQDVRQIFLTRLRDQLRREGAEAVAKLDALTGLPNRRQLDETVKKIWAEGEGDSLVTVVMIDIDHFKLFNDRLRPRCRRHLSQARGRRHCHRIAQHG